MVAGGVRVGAIVEAGAFEASAFVEAGAFEAGAFVAEEAFFVRGDCTAGTGRHSCRAGSAFCGVGFPG